MTDYKAIHARLKEAKDASGLMNAEISEKSGVPIGTVNKLLAGQTKDAYITSLSAVCEAIGADVNYICFGKTPKSQTHDEARLVFLYRQTNPEGKEKILSYAEDISKVYKKDSAPCMVSEIEA